VHGFNGINSVSLYGFPEPIDGRVIETTKQLAEFPFNVDYNSGYHLGIGEPNTAPWHSRRTQTNLGPTTSVGWAQFTIGNGARSSSATSYLGPKFIGRKNLHVLINTEVSRILSSGVKQGQHVFNIVQYRAPGGSLKTVVAKREVILSAGAVNSPRILLHSGIGNSTLLSQFGIPTLVDNPSVGRNLSDHPIVSNVYTTNSTNTYEALTQNATATQEAIELWNNTRTGIFASGTFNHLGFIRLPANASIFSANADPAAGPKTAHFEFIIGV
jgi:choline dehydrogenase-like flavoprotein